MQTTILPYPLTVNIKFFQKKEKKKAHQSWKAENKVDTEIRNYLNWILN